MEICFECESKDIEYSDRLGEIVCNACGLVLVQQLLEETTYSLDHEITGSELGSTIKSSDAAKYGRKGFTLFRAQKYGQPNSIYYVRMVRLSNVYLTKYSISPDIRKRITKYYKSFVAKQKVATISMEIRAAGLTYFILKELNLAVSPQEHAKLAGVEVKYMLRFAKRLGSVLGKPYVFSNININGMVDKAASRLINPSPEYIGDVQTFSKYMEQKYHLVNKRFSRATLAASFYIVSLVRREHYTQERISEIAQVSEVGLRNHVKIILELLNIKKSNLDYMTLNELMR
tara:strand:+ start:18562 stop:19425 length:864 start_codon:yes stop_codon:yes gene_type:complete